jgi:hypothetical protein
MFCLTGGGNMAAFSHPTQREYMRTSGTESRSRYLSMALASRNLMKSLDEFGSTGQRGERLRKSIENLLSILDTGWQTNNSFAPVPSESPFARFEQAATVNEVAGLFESKAVKVKETLSGILGGTVDASSRQAVVREMNQFLYSLENRALHSYNGQFDEP